MLKKLMTNIALLSQTEVAAISFPEIYTFENQSY